MSENDKGAIGCFVGLLLGVTAFVLLIFPSIWLPKPPQHDVIELDAAQWVCVKSHVIFIGMAVSSECDEYLRVGIQ